MMNRKLLCLIPAVAFVTVLSLGGCSSSSGGGSSDPPKRATVVLPSGTKVVCENGQPPPC